MSLDRVTVVVTVYNSARALPTSLGSLLDVPRVVVVDNNSQDGTSEVARETHPGVEVIHHPHNSGITVATNLGFKAATTEYILHINPDTQLSPGCVASLVETMDANPNAAGAAPLLLNNHGHQEVDVMGPFEHNHHKIAVPPEGPFCTWFVTGAVVLWRRSVLEQVEGFDENFFLYQEDADLCIRSINAGYMFILDPRVIASHFGGQSEKISSKTRYRKDWNQTWSSYYYEDKHSEPGSGTSAARQSLIPFALKAVTGLFLLRRKMVVGYCAKTAATWRYLNGCPSWLRTGSGPQTTLLRDRMSTIPST
jgi:N-acetylglucosaminyl-diphospho-decaprenol L-rhamnosyltransferase